jgi:hypothetical protein
MAPDGYPAPNQIVCRKADEPKRHPETWRIEGKYSV